MKLLCIGILLVLCVSPMSTTPSKTIVRIKKPAIEYACQTQKRSIQNAFGLIPIPDVSTKSDRGIIGSIFDNGGLIGAATSFLGKVLKIVGIEVVDVKLPDVTVKLIPNVGVQVSVDSHLQIRGDISLIGGLEINLDAGVVARFVISNTERGSPILGVSTCKSVLGDIKVSAWGISLLPMVKRTIQGHIHNILDDRLCVSVTNIFLGFNADLGLMTEMYVINDELGFKYIMPSPPVVTDDYMDMNMIVKYKVHDKDVDLLAHAKDFTLPPNAGTKDSMVNMGLSRDFFISLFTAIQSSGGFDLQIPSTISSIANMLRTSVLGSHIPEINWRYPQSLPVDMNIVLSKCPEVSFQSGKLLVNVSPYVEMFVVLPSSRYQHLLTINVPSLIAGYMRKVFEKVYLVQINEVLSEGVSLPSLPNMQFLHSVVDVKEDYAVMSYDVQYVK
ncbi:BPI fold-containing family B member 2 [Rhinophrynus dorsalis]